MKKKRLKRGYHNCHNLKKGTKQKKQGGQNHKDEIPLTDLWGLNSTLGGIIVPYLKAFKEAISFSGATPAAFCVRNEDGKDVIASDEGWKKWSEALDKMIWSFEEYSRMDGSPGKEPKEYYDKLQERLNLFAKYYSDLWY